MKNRMKLSVSIILVLMFILSSVFCVPVSADNVAFVQWTEADGSIGYINHVALHGADSSDPNYGNYQYVAQEFIPATTSLSGVKLMFNLTAGNCTLHLEIRENINDADTALINKDFGITSLGDGMYWYDFNFGENVAVEKNKTYYLLWYVTDRTATSLMLNCGSDISTNKGPAAWIHNMSGAEYSRAYNVIACFQLITDVVSNEPFFNQWTENDATIGYINHVALEGADSTDGNYNNYQYVGQTFIPNNPNLSGAELMFNLTAGTAKIHLEVRRKIDETAVYTKDFDVESQGDGIYWYTFNFAEDLSVKPFEEYVLVWWALDRTATSLMLNCGTDNAQNTNPASYSRLMSQEAYGSPYNVTYAFRLITTYTGVPAISAAALVAEAIEELPSTDALTLDDEAGIVKIRAMYDALEEAEKTDVTNYDNLVAAENKIAQLKVMIEVERIIAAINSIPAENDLSVVYKELTAELEEAYSKLDQDSKLLVTNYEKLQAAAEKITELEGKISRQIDAKGLLDYAGPNLVGYGDEQGWQVDPGQTNSWVFYNFNNTFGPGRYRLGVKVKLENLSAPPVISIKTTDNDNAGAEVMKKDLAFTDYEAAEKDEDGFAVLYSDVFEVTDELAGHALEGKVLAYTEFHGENALIVFDGAYWVDADDTSVIHSSITDLSSWGSRGASGKKYYSEEANRVEFARHETSGPADEYGYSFSNVELGTLKKGKYAVDIEYSASNIESGDIFEFELFVDGERLNSELVTVNSYGSACKTSDGKSASVIEFELDTVAPATVGVYQFNGATTNYYSISLYAIDVVDVDEAVAAVITAVDTLPDPEEITYASKNDVVAVRDAYNSLTDEQKNEVSNIEKYNSVIAAYHNAIRGYVSGGEKITASDALMALQCAVNKISLAGDAFIAADVDKSGDVKASDALLILQFAVNKIDSFDR